MSRPPSRVTNRPVADSPSRTGERQPLLGSPPPPSSRVRKTKTEPARLGQTRTDSESDLRSPGEARRPGSMTPQSRTEVAFATLPERLSRAAEQAQKRERVEEDLTRWQLLYRRARYYIPVLQWLPHYSLKSFMRDVVAALTLTSLIAPQSMSYATNLVHTDPVHGLFGAAVPAMIYSAMGTCRQLSVGPEAALSLITGETIAKFIEEEEHAHGRMSDAHRAKFIAKIITVITFESGLVTFLLGFFRLGFLDAVLSRALLRGFMTAVAVTIFVSQAASILGIEAGLDAAYGASSSVLEKVQYIATHLGETHRLTLLVSIIALAALIGGKIGKRTVAQKKGYWRIALYVPEVLLVVVLSTVLSHIFHWSHAGLSVLGRVSPGDVKVRVPFVGWGYMRRYITKSFGTSTVIAILGFLDSIVAAKDMASKHDYPISPNRELCALGSANLFAAFCTGSLPGYGSITRSRLASATGARTQMSSLLTGTFVLLVTYFLLRFLGPLPKCILAVIVCVVVFSIFEETPEDVKFFYNMGSWTDGGLMLLTFALSLFVSVEVGIITSVALSMLLCIKHSTAMRLNILGRVPGTSTFEPLEDDLNDDGLLPVMGEEVPGVLIVKIRDVALTFANTGYMKERLRRLERYGHGRHHPAEEPRREEASVVIFDLTDVSEVDASALQIMLELVDSYAARNVLIYWTQCNPRALARLREAGVVDKSGGDAHVQPSVARALEEIHETMTMLQVNGGSGGGGADASSIV